jgi:hypothetical protein
MAREGPIRVILPAKTQKIEAADTPPLMPHPGTLAEHHPHAADGQALDAKKHEVFNALPALASGGLFATETSVLGGKPGERMLAFDWAIADYKLGGQVIVADDGLKAIVDENSKPGGQGDSVRLLSQDRTRFKEMSLMDFAKNQRLWADGEGMKAVRELATIGSSLEPQATLTPAESQRIAASAAAIQRTGELFSVEERDETQLNWRISGVDSSSGMIRLTRYDDGKTENSSVGFGDFALLQHRWLRTPPMKAVLDIAAQAEPQPAPESGSGPLHHFAKKPPV